MAGQACRIRAAGRYGVIAIASGPLPALIGLSAVFVAVRIGVTVPETVLETYAVFPSGVIAIADGALPTLIGLERGVGGDAGSGSLVPELLLAT